MVSVIAEWLEMGTIHQAVILLSRMLPSSSLTLSQLFLSSLTAPLLQGHENEIP